MAAHASKQKLFQKETFGISFDSDELVNQLKKFAEKAKEQAFRPAAFAAATVLYDEMKLRVPVKTGGLRDSIYRFYDENQSSDNLVVFVTGPNKVKAPHWHIVEFGSVRSVAQPYIRPTFDSKIQLALTKASQTIAERIKDLK